MSTSRIRHGVVGIVAVGVAVLGTACEDEDPSDPITPSGKAIPPETSTPSTPATDVAESLAPSDVVHAWIEALNAALRGGDAGDAKQFTTAGCWTCEEHVAPIAETIDSGGWFQGGRWSVIRARIAERTATNASVYAAISAASGTTVPRRGAERRHYEAEKFILDFKLEHSPDGWLIAEIVYLR